MIFLGAAEHRDFTEKPGARKLRVFEHRSMWELLEQRVLIFDTEGESPVNSVSIVVSVR